MKVRLHPEAREEIREKARDFNGRCRGLGRELLLEVNVSMRRIGRLPNSGPLLPDAPPELGIHYVILRRFPFIVAYQILERHVLVLSLVPDGMLRDYLIGRASPQRQPSQP